MLRFFRSIIRTYLDPAERFGEMLFGLIMVLTFTLGAGMIVPEGREGVRELLIATIGCNIAWGAIDAVIYIMLRMSERSRRMSLALKIRSITEDEKAVEAIDREVELEYEDLFSKDVKERICRDILNHVRNATPKKVKIEKSDMLGGLATFFLVFISTVPAAVPFFFFDNTRFAVRISNLLLMCAIFMLGSRWAAQTRTNRMLGGLSMTAIGAALVGIALLLGG